MVKVVMGKTGMSSWEWEGLGTVKVIPVPDSCSGILELETFRRRLFIRAFNAREYTYTGLSLGNEVARPPRHVVREHVDDKSATSRVMSCCCKVK